MYKLVGFGETLSITAHTLRYIKAKLGQLRRTLCEKRTLSTIALDLGLLSLPSHIVSAREGLRSVYAAATTSISSGSRYLKLEINSNAMDVEPKDRWNPAQGICEGRRHVVRI